MRVESVTSAQNPKIKHLLALQEKSRLRREEGVFVVEGRRELQHCLEGGFTVDTVFFCPAIFGKALTDPEGNVPLKPMATPGLVRGRGPSPDGRGPAQQDGFRGTLPQGSMPMATPGLVRGRDPSPDGRGPAQQDGFRGTLPQGSMPMATPGPAPALPLSLPSQTRIIEVSEELYRKIAYRESTEGILAEVRSRDLSLTDLDLGPKPLIVVLEGVEKPGNLGAVLRSADAAGACAVLICDALTDLWNPNLIRSSIGAVFTVPTVCCSSEDAIRFLKKHRVQILTAQLQDSSVYYDVDMTRGTAIVIGTESTGLSDGWREAATNHVLIPMLGRLDSLNASVSAAVLLYEAVRQRQARESGR